MDYKFLEAVNSPDDLKALSDGDIPVLCDEIRHFLIENVNKSGGHLASNLGVVELTVAIHKIFDSPKDHIIFDVGHQAYVHKLLTGRREKFPELRVPGGLSGFTSRRESPHDPFGAGHSSTSISAALGFAEADALRGNNAFSICVIGDGAYTGGMVHEALNNCKRDLPLIIIINENRMSISQNKGAFASYLAKVRISKSYRRWKEGTNSFLGHLGAFGRFTQSILSYTKNKLKRIVYSTNYFEDLGLYYIGPVDGNNYETVKNALAEAKRLGKCTVIHTYTQKGKGYKPAEESPHSFHSVQSSSAFGDTLHSVFADELISLAREDESIVAVTAAMGIGTGLCAFEKTYPKRYFDVGIAEAHALTFSAGLAAAGMKPYVAIYSTFLQRGYDNIVHDIALQNLPVKIMIDRAGLAASDGATHHGIFDVSFLSHIPNMTLYAPVTYGSLAEVMKASRDAQSPFAVRYANSAEIPSIRDKFYPNGNFSAVGAVADFEKGNTPRLVFVTYGNITAKVIEAQAMLHSDGYDAGIVLVEKLCPYGDSVRMLSEYLCGAERVLFVEEGILNGGYSMITVNKLTSSYPELNGIAFDIAAIDESFAVPDTRCDIYEYLGLSPRALYERMKKQIGDTV